MSDSLVVTEVYSPDAMARLGARLAARLRRGDVVALDGDLGSGKTTLARGLIRALAGESTVVPSPTFTIVQTYDTPSFELWHCDFYRLSTPEDAFELGLDEAFSDAVVVVEWPDRIGSMLPGSCLHIRIEQGSDEDARRVTLVGDAQWAERLRGLEVEDA